MYQDFLKEYQAELIAHIQALDPARIQAFVETLVTAYQQDKQIFVMGNGGSAATANHFSCDFGKNAVQGDRRRFRILSLSSNVEAITALGNDISFDEIFRQQLINLMNEGDVLIAISASGNSPDIIKAVEYARERGGKVVGLAGFRGGKLEAMSDVSMVAHMNSYERVEDIHLIILHIVICFLKEHQELLEAPANA